MQSDDSHTSIDDGDDMTLSKTADIFRALESIFGEQVRINDNFLRYLQLSGLKAAYRKKVKEAHPDLGGSSGEGFLEVKEAFDLLREYISGRDKDGKNPGFHTATQKQRGRQKGASEFAGQSGQKTEGYSGRSHSGSPSSASQTAGTRPADHRFSGEVPMCTLRFGQYLYYRGRISWKQLIDAVCWQKSQRPTFGAIALELGYADNPSLARIGRAKRQGEFFGDTALRLGIISEFQLRTILFRQQRYAMPIGKYFESILGRGELQSFLAEHKEHNRKYQ